MNQEDLDYLYEIILSIRTKSECKDFLEDLLSKKELESIAARVTSARLLMDGKTYVEIMNDVEISSATLARINKCIKTGHGYNSVVRRNKKRR